MLADVLVSGLPEAGIRVIRHVMPTIHRSATFPEGRHTDTDSFLFDARRAVVSAERMLSKWKALHDQANIVLGERETLRILNELPFSE